MLNQIIKVPEKINKVFTDSEVIEQFKTILNGGTNSFIQSAMIAIAASEDLMNCTPQSLVIGSLRSAALGLSLDPALRQAYLVPRPLNQIWTACFQPHYNGLYDLAVRTNRYKYISVSPIHKGETVLEDPLTGLHVYQLEGRQTLMAPNPGANGLHPELRDVTSGKNTDPVIGYLGYFQTLKGYQKSVWMTVKEIHAHALLWSPGSYKSSKGAWQDPKKVPIMEMKTVFIALSKFMDLSGEDNSKLREAINATAEEEPITVEVEDVTESAPEELEIESSVPGPSRAVVNQRISDFEWTTFTKLVERAQRAGIPIKEYNREKMTPDFLNKSTIFYQDQLAKKK